MTIHVSLPDGAHAACRRSSEDDHVITFSEATAPDGRHFDCVDCHKTLTGGWRHTPYHDPRAEVGPS